jgi:hypothetical protein
MIKYWSHLNLTHFQKAPQGKMFLFKAYKTHNLGIPWQCETLNTPPQVWHLLVKHVFNIRREGPTCPRTCSSDTILNSLELYLFSKGSSRKKVCSRLIKPTTQIYLGNIGLLTTRRPGIFWPIIFHTI